MAILTSKKLFMLKNNQFILNKVVFIEAINSN